MCWPLRLFIFAHFCKVLQYNTKFFLELVYRSDVLFPAPFKTVKNGT